MLVWAPCENRPLASTKNLRASTLISRRGRGPFRTKWVPALRKLPRNGAERVAAARRAFAPAAFRPGAGPPPVARAGPRMPDRLPQRRHPQKRSLGRGAGHLPTFPSGGVRRSDPAARVPPPGGPREASRERPLHAPVGAAPARARPCPGGRPAPPPVRHGPSPHPVRARPRQRAALPAGLPESHPPTRRPTGGETRPRLSSGAVRGRCPPG
jgi:hypothetical protein